MKILDLYLLSRFFKLMSFIILAGIAIFLAVDLIENLDKFIDRDVGWPMILRYYLYYIPYIIYLILPVTVLLTTLFALGSMANANEITAMKASGVSLYRILIVLGMVGITMSAGALSFGETIVPYFNKQRMDIQRHEVKKIPRSSATRRGRIYLLDGPNRLVFIGHFNGETMAAYSVQVHTTSGNTLTSRLDAKRMVYTKNRWIVYDAVRRTFQGDSVIVEKVPAFDWRELAFLPDDLMKIQSQPEEMNYWELKEYVGKLVATGADARRWRVDLSAKLATPFAVFIIVIFGVPIAVKKRRSGLMVGFGIALLTAFLYFGASNTGKMLGYKGMLEPWMAAWVGHLLFGMVGIISVAVSRK